MDDCEPSPNKGKPHHKSQSDVCQDIITIGLEGPNSALVKKSGELGHTKVESHSLGEGGFTFDKSKTVTPCTSLPLEELNINDGIKDMSNSMRSKSTPGIHTKLHILTPMTPMSPDFVMKKPKLNYT
jgi:hypothetical protein